MLKKPFSTYNGGKAGMGTYQNIINFIPKCDCFVDAMVGNGGISCNLKLPNLTIINDIDTTVAVSYDCSGQDNKIIVENIDYRPLIEKYKNRQNVFFYLDPPYLKSARKSQLDLYKFDWSEADHIEFLVFIKELKVKCMISHYPCELYDNYLSGWCTHDFQNNTRNGYVTDRIYMNYDKPTILQDFSYLGNNNNDRQRIKRKTARFLNKLELMPDLERTGIMSSILDKYSDTAKLLNN